MTALCGGGPSEIRPGFETIQNMSGGAIAALLAFTKDRQTAAILGAVLSGIAPNLETLCLVDPPEDPLLTDQDIADVLVPGNLVRWLPAQERIKQWFLRQYWFIACQCQGGDTPPMPPISDPGPSGQDDGLPSGPTAPLCWQGTATASGFTFAPPHTAATVGRALLEALPGTVTQTITPAIVTQITTDVAKVLPAGPIHDIRIRFRGTTALGREIPGINFRFYNAAGTFVGNQTLMLPQVQNFDLVASIGDPPAGATCWYPFLYTGDSDVHEYSCTFELSYTCGASPNTPVTPCCPPDINVELKLNQILDILLQHVTAPPLAGTSSWRDGVRHTNLLANGHLTLVGVAVGIRVEVHSIPPNIPLHLGDPNFYFDLGFITPLAIDVPIRGQRLMFTPQSFQLPAVADGIAWTLPPGVVIDIVELLPF